MNLFQHTSEQISKKFTDHIKDSLTPLPTYLRKLGIGLAFILASTIGWLGTFLFLILALFFSLTNLPGFVSASLWTALVSFVIGLVLTLTGLKLLKAPRR